jgi:hypothetical protein
MTPEEFAHEFWKRLVGRVGEPTAKAIMQRVMGRRGGGRTRTDEAHALNTFMYALIRRFPGSTDGNIAKAIFESAPHYIQYESGAIAVVNDWMTEEDMSLDDDPIIGARRPINKSLPTLKKQVERVRRETLGWGILPKEYAPRKYRRD